MRQDGTPMMQGGPNGFLRPFLLCALALPPCFELPDDCWVRGNDTSTHG